MKIFKKCVARYSFLLFLYLITKTYAQDVISGECKSVQPEEEFDLKDYLGRWYQIAASSRESEKNQNCIEYHNWDTRGEKTPVTRLYVGPDGEKYNLTRNAKFSKLEGKGTSIEGYPFTILDTDYDNYSAVYVCMNVVGGHKEIVFILGRERTLDASTVKKAIRIFVKNNINYSSLKFRNQTDCPDDWEGAKKV